MNGLMTEKIRGATVWLCALPIVNALGYAWGGKEIITEKQELILTEYVWFERKKWKIVRLIYSTAWEYSSEYWSS